MFKSLKLILLMTFCLGVFGCSGDKESTPWMPIDPMPHATCEEGDICAYDSQDKFLGIVLFHHYIGKKKHMWHTEILIPEGYHLYLDEQGTESEEYLAPFFYTQQWPLVIDDSDKSLLIAETYQRASPKTTLNFMTNEGGGFETPKRICFGGFADPINPESVKIVIDEPYPHETYPSVTMYEHMSTDPNYFYTYAFKVEECPKGMLPDVLDLPITLKDSDGNVFEDEYLK